MTCMVPSMQSSLHENCIFSLANMFLVKCPCKNAQKCVLFVDCVSHDFMYRSPYVIPSMPTPEAQQSFHDLPPA